MNFSRRGFLGRVALVGLAAPAVITTPGLLMRVRSLFLPTTSLIISTQAHVDFSFTDEEFKPTLDEFASRYLDPLVKQLHEKLKRDPYFVRMWVDDDGIQMQSIEAPLVFA